MLAQDKISRYTSSNQEYGSSAPPIWSPSKSTNVGPGTTDIIGKSVYQHQNSHLPALNLTHTGNGALQQHQRQIGIGPNGHTRFSQLNSNNAGSGLIEPKYPNLLYNTGEPLGSLSSSIIDGVDAKYSLTREEMKDKLANTLSSQTSGGILPGYKPNHYGSNGISGLKNTRSSSYMDDGLDNVPDERVPSPVARARAAIGKTRQEISVAKEILQANNTKITGIYRHPRGDPWVNASTPGVGEDSYSMKKFKQDSYRRELETQMEQSRLRKEVELKEDREGHHHPLGSNYNSPLPYTFSIDDSKRFGASTTNNNGRSYPDYLKAKSDSIGTKGPNPPPRIGSSDLGRPQVASPSPMSSPWLDQKPTTPGNNNNFRGQTQFQSTMVPNFRQQSNSTYFSPSPQQPSVQQFQPNYSNQYYPPPQPPLPVYHPFGYSYPPQPTPPIPYPVYSPTPQIPAYTLQPPIYPQAQQYSSPPQPPIQSPQYSQQFNQNSSGSSSFPNLQISTSMQGKSGHASSPHMSTIDDISLNSDDEVEVDESAIRQHIWQTSDQLPSDDLKRALYKTELTKQIIQKKRINEVERAKEIEEDWKLERSIHEYQEKMRKQIESEQQIIRLKQMGTGVGKSPMEVKAKLTQNRVNHNIKKVQNQNNQKETGVDQDQEPLKQMITSDFDETPCRPKFELEGGDGNGNRFHIPDPPDISDVIIKEEIDSTSKFKCPVEPEEEKIVEHEITESGDNPKVKKKGASKLNRKSLAHIQQALRMEIQRMEYLLGKPKTNN